MADGILTARLDAQGVLQPGEQGWWKVWGASARSIRTGDMLMAKRGDEYFECEVANVDHSSPSHPA